MATAEVAVVAVAEPTRVLAEAADEPLLGWITPMKLPPGGLDRASPARLPLKPIQHEQGSAPATDGAAPTALAVVEPAGDGGQAEDIFEHPLVKSLLYQQRLLKENAEEQASAMARLQERASEAAAAAAAQRHQLLELWRRAEAAEAGHAAAKQRAELAEAAAGGLGEQLTTARKLLESLSSKAKAAAAARAIQVHELTKRAEIAEVALGAARQQAAEAAGQNTEQERRASALQDRVAELESTVDKLRAQYQEDSLFAAQELGRARQQAEAATATAQAACEQQVSDLRAKLAEQTRRAEAGEEALLQARQLLEGVQQKAAAATAARSSLVAELTHRAEVAEEQLAEARQQLEALQGQQQAPPVVTEGAAAGGDEQAPAIRVPAAATAGAGTYSRQSSGGLDPKLLPPGEQAVAPRLGRVGSKEQLPPMAPAPSLRRSGSASSCATAPSPTAGFAATDAAGEPGSGGESDSEERELRRRAEAEAAAQRAQQAAAEALLLEARRQLEGSALAAGDGQ